jgi:hypothetical protein
MRAVETGLRTLPEKTDERRGATGEPKQKDGTPSAPVLPYSRRPRFRKRSLDGRSGTTRGVLGYF